LLKVAPRSLSMTGSRYFQKDKRLTRTRDDDRPMVKM